MTTPTSHIGSLRSYAIAYRTDLGRVGSEEIPLGIIADLRVGQRYGIGLRARKEVSDAESEKIGELVRDRLRRPFELLKEEFEYVRSSADSAIAFAELANEHAMAFAFCKLETQSVRVPSDLAADVDSPALRKWIMDHVQICLAKRFAVFVKDSEDSAPPEESYAAA